MDNPIEKLVGSAMSQIRDSLGMRVFITYMHVVKKRFSVKMQFKMSQIPAVVKTILNSKSKTITKYKNL